MSILFRAVFAEITSGATLGVVLFTFVLFLEKASDLFKALVNAAATPQTVGYLFLLLLPSTLPLTLPLGALVGTLIGLSRMSGDGEITALRASGISARRVAWPVLCFALLALAATAASSLWLAPLSIRETFRVLNDLGAAQLTAEIQPRVFEESFPNKVLYVGDVIPTRPVEWRNVFVADLTPPAERRDKGPEAGEGPLVTVAERAIAHSDPEHNRIQLSFQQGNSYEAAADPEKYYQTDFPHSEQVLEARPRGEVHAKEYSATPTPELALQAPQSLDARIELNRRFALPLACVLLAFTGLPLGVSSRKGGKSAAFVLTVFFAFLYYMALISLIGLARERRLGAELAVWLPNAAFAAAGVFFTLTLERPGDHDLLGRAGAWFAYSWRRLKALRSATPLLRRPAHGGERQTRLFLLPQLIDTYVLSSFVFYSALMLLSFVLLTEVFNFFELLGDVFRTGTPMARLFRYLFFLAPKLIYDAAPVSILVGVLITFGVLTKNNEITAMKACGVSVYRLAAPILLASLAASGLLFAFDYYVVPGANLIQDALRNEIKGRPVQTYLNPDRKWIFGQQSRIFYFRFFEPNENVMGGVSVFDFDPHSFRLRRHLTAERARWEPALNAWVFQNGWARELGSRNAVYRPFLHQTATFPEINEPPGYFMKEVKTYKQMNHLQLAAYMRELRQSGFNTVPLRVQYQKKFSVPLFALIMALLSTPFAFLTGGKGAMTGIGVSFGVAISYFSLNYLFEQLGAIALLPATVAAWAPGAIFALAGLYLMTRLRT